MTNLMILNEIRRSRDLLDEMESHLRLLSDRLYAKIKREIELEARLAQYETPPATNDAPVCEMQQADAGSEGR